MLSPTSGVKESQGGTLWARRDIRGQEGNIPAGAAVGDSKECSGAASELPAHLLATAWVCPLTAGKCHQSPTVGDGPGCHLGHPDIQHPHHLSPGWSSSRRSALCNRMKTTPFQVKQRYLWIKSKFNTLS